MPKVAKPAKVTPAKKGREPAAAVSKARAPAHDRNEKSAKPAKPAKDAKDAKPARSTKTPKSAPAKAAPEPAALEAALDESTPTKPARRASAETMATKQRDISVSEFFTKNRHLLGFDNPAKALLTTVKEAVDNSLDACEEAGILPELLVEIHEVGENRFRVAIEDNGPGIVKPQIPKIFAKLLYGSKFHRLKQSRGQQGIGISAAGLYGQLTTGKPVAILSKTGKGRPAYRIELRIDNKRNQPDVVKDETTEWDKDHGTRVEIELVGAYRGGRTGVDAYLEQTVVANPHLALTYKPPKGEATTYPRVTNELPREAQEIKPHPHGVELGMLISMLNDSSNETVKTVLTDSFSRVSPAIADQICAMAKVSAKAKAGTIHGDAVERLHKALGEVKVMAPSASCVVPIGEELLIEGLKRRFKAEVYFSSTRPPSVYRGNPFVVEVGVAWGGELPVDEPAEILRFANRVPLQYQPKACAISESVYETNWKAYSLTQPRGSLPVGPLAIVVHLASVWVPFTSEAKEAVAQYDDLLREMKLALQECGRKLGAHVRAQVRANNELKRMSIFQRYIPEVANAIGLILSVEKGKVEKSFYETLPKFVNITLDKDEEPPASGTPSMPPPAGEGGAAAATAITPARRGADKAGAGDKAVGAGKAGKAKSKLDKPKPKKRAPEQLSLV
jgi:DNA topoisomerase-6 subunit B